MTQRTDQQNKALHVLFKEIADALNEHGLTVQEVLAQTMEFDWNERLVKENIWKRAQQKILGKQSTTQLDKQMEIDQVYDTVNRWLAHLKKDGIELGIHVPFPNDDTKIGNYDLVDKSLVEKESW